MATFYMVEDFARITGANKPRLKNVCPDCGKGVLFSAEQPLIRYSMNQMTYECSGCHSQHIVQFEV